MTNSSKVPEMSVAELIRLKEWEVTMLKREVAVALAQMAAEIDRLKRTSAS